MKTLRARLGTYLEIFAPKPLVLLALFCGLLLPLVIFGKIADHIRDNQIFVRDTLILNAIHQYSSPARDRLVMDFTDLGRIWIMVPFCVVVTVLLFFLHQKHQALFFALCSGGGALLNLLTKMFFGRARPALWISPAPEFDYGFPSGHAMVSMCVVAALIILSWPTKGRWITSILGTIFVLAIGFTRLYLGVHYPTDVLGGWCAALLWVSGVYIVMKARQRWRGRVLKPVIEV